MEKNEKRSYNENKVQKCCETTFLFVYFENI